MKFWRKLFYSKNKNPIIQNSDSIFMHYIRHNQIKKINIEDLSETEVMKRNQFGDSILSMCIEKSFNLLAKKIVLKFKVENEVNKFTKTPLMNAIESENVEMFYFLLNQGADYNYINDDGESVLSCAARKKQFLAEVIKKNNIQTHIDFPNLKNPLIISSISKIDEEVLYSKLIEFGYLESLHTQDIIRLIKNLMDIFQIRSIQKICTSNIKKDSFVNFNHILYKDKEGFVNGKLLIKLEDFKNFKFIDYDLEKFHKILNLENKDIIGLFYRKILKSQGSGLFENLWEINYSLINSLDFLKRNFDIDENLMKPMFYSEISFPMQLDENTFKKLLINYNDRRKISLICGEFNGYYLRDTLYMFEQLSRFCMEFNLEIKNFLPPKPKNITEIHDKLQRVVYKIGKNNIPIDSYLNKEFRKINGMQFKEYKIQIPKNNAELIEVSESLAICVANGYYSSQMVKGNTLILLLKKDKKVNYCVEFCLNTHKILQAMTYYNTEMEKHSRNQLEALIYSLTAPERLENTKDNNESSN